MRKARVQRSKKTAPKRTETLQRQYAELFDRVPPRKQPTGDPENLDQPDFLDVVPAVTTYALPDCEPGV